MYDIVIVNCPKCNKEVEFQSKSGDCGLWEFPLNECPIDILRDVNRHSPYICECGTWFKVNIDTRKAEKVNNT